MSAMFFGEEMGMDGGMFLNGINHWRVRAEVAEMNLSDVPWGEIKRVLAVVDGVEKLGAEVQRIWTWVDTHEPLREQGE